MIKRSLSLAACGALTLFASCERHGPEVLDKFPGHHAAHDEVPGAAAHHEESTAEGTVEHEVLDQPGPARPAGDSTPPRYFND